LRGSSSAQTAAATVRNAIAEVIFICLSRLQLLSAPHQRIVRCDQCDATFFQTTAFFLKFVPSRRTINAQIASAFAALMMPCAIVHFMIPPKYLPESFHFLVSDQDFERFRSPALQSRRRDIEKVSRFATVEFDNVHW